MALTLNLGDMVCMKKRHPCGGNEWLVGRLGADIGLTCQTCGRHMLAARSYLERRVKQVSPQAIAQHGSMEGHREDSTDVVQS